jgi:cytochrome c-type biogenesis protein CcmF
MAVVVLLGYRGFGATVAFGLGAFCIAGIVRNFAIAVRARRRAHHEAVPVALARTVRSNPRRWGGLVVHTGVVIIAVAIAGSQSWGTRREVRLAKNQTVVVAGHSITYLGDRVVQSSQKTTLKVRIRVRHGSDDFGVYAPAISTFPGSNQGIGTPSVHVGVTNDVYLSLLNAPDDNGRILLQVLVNPLVLWLWLGGAVMALGTLLCLVPMRRTRLDVAAAPEPVRELAEVGS